MSSIQHGVLFPSGQEARCKDHIVIIKSTVHFPPVFFSPQPIWLKTSTDQIFLVNVIESLVYLSILNK